jgi:hypothetical protein
MKAEQNNYKKEFKNMQKEMEDMKTYHHSTTKSLSPSLPPTF